jgi:YHS domain-containing protein
MAQVIDPVCGMTVDTETAEHKSTYEGSAYYFCAAGCKRAFDKNPTEYVRKAHGDHEDHGGHGHAHEHTGHTR